MLRLTVTKDQFIQSVDAFKNNDPFDHVLVDERTPEGEIVTILVYDEESILIQKIFEKGLEYNIVPIEEYFGGERVEGGDVDGRY